MTGMHCMKFPACPEFSEKPQAPKCGKPDCPGTESWTKVFPTAPATPDWQSRHLDQIVVRLSKWRNEDNEDAIVLTRSEICTILDTIPAVADTRRTEGAGSTPPGIFADQQAPS